MCELAPQCGGSRENIIKDALQLFFPELTAAINLPYCIIPRSRRKFNFTCKAATARALYYYHPVCNNEEVQLETLYYGHSSAPLGVKIISLDNFMKKKIRYFYFFLSPLEGSLLSPMLFFSSIYTYIYEVYIQREREKKLCVYVL